MREKFQSGREILALGILYVISQSLLIVILNPLGVETFLKLQVSFSKDFYLQAFDTWKAQGVFGRYVLHLYPDMIHPFVFGLFLFSLLQKLRAPLAVLALPFVSAAADYVENTVQFVILSGRLTDPLVFLSSLMSVIKWGLILLSIVLIAALAVRRAFVSSK